MESPAFRAIGVATLQAKKTPLSHSSTPHRVAADGHKFTVLVNMNMSTHRLDHFFALNTMVPAAGAGCCCGDAAVALKPQRSFERTSGVPAVQSTRSGRHQALMPPPRRLETRR